MLQRAVLLAVACFACALPTRSIAQYMYLDANGDGVHTAADVVQPTGPTTVDVWLRTDTNRNGQPATCSTADGNLTINSYEVILRVVAGSVSWGTFTNRQSDFTTIFGTAAAGTDFYAGRGGATILPPGLYRLCTIIVTRTSGFPTLTFATSTQLGPFYTSFGSNCSGIDFDNTLKFGQDWFDADGLVYGGPAPTPPVLGEVADMAVDEMQVATQDITATDANGDAIAFIKASGPSFMSVTTVSSAGGVGTGRIRLAPGTRDAGSYVGTVRASDGFVYDEQGFRMTVAPVRSPIDLAPIPDVTVAQHQVVEIPLSATSPDAASINYGTTTPYPFLSIASGPKVGATLVVAPGPRTDVGVWDVAIYAEDEVASDFEHSTVTVTSNPTPPDGSYRHDSGNRRRGHG